VSSASTSRPDDDHCIIRRMRKKHSHMGIPLGRPFPLASLVIASQVAMVYRFLCSRNWIIKRWRLGVQSWASLSVDENGRSSLSNKNAASEQPRNGLWSGSRNDDMKWKVKSLCFSKEIINNLGHKQPSVPVIIMAPHPNPMLRFSCSCTYKTDSNLCPKHTPSLTGDAPRQETIQHTPVETLNRGS